MCSEATRMKKIVHMPLESLWGADGAEALSRGSDLGDQAIRDLLRQGAFRFVVANCGHAPEWIPSSECFEFWKTEAQPHLVNDPDEDFYLEDFPGEYAYTASLCLADPSVVDDLIEKRLNRK